jgi:OOP family OmpA-OmpF porin
MKKSVLSSFLLLLCGALLAACAGMKAREAPMTFTPATIEAGKYIPKVDNFLIILDASYSMEKDGQRNFQTAKNVITAINQSIPSAMHFTGGLRTFGHHPQFSAKPTELIYGMTTYSREGLQQGLDRIQHAGDNSPLPKALMAAGGDLMGLQGKSAIIIVSDGDVKLEMGGAPAAAAKLKAEMGNRLCIYTIDVGGDPAGEKFLQEVAGAGGCGFATTAAALAAPGGMSSFVENVFLSPKPAAAAAMVPPPMDSDGDGVIDSLDKCPNTPRGVMVDKDGCPLKLTIHINFAFDKADIKPEFDPELKKAAEFIQKYPKVPYILLEGYTDSTGPADYNQMLSQKRAEAVKQYLVDKYGIDPNRLIARGGGESNPVASNDTAEGRAQNRRTEIICCAVIPPK